MAGGVGIINRINGSILPIREVVEMPNTIPESLRCALHSRDSRFLLRNVSSQTFMDQHFAQCPTASAPPGVRSRTECSSDTPTYWQQRSSDNQTPNSRTIQHSGNAF